MTPIEHTETLEQVKGVSAVAADETVIAAQTVPPSVVLYILVSVAPFDPTIFVDSR
jgi:hypothetical protein